MGSWAWTGLVIGLVIVALAVGIPFFLTHRRMREPRDLASSRDYLRARRKWRLQRRARAARSPEATGPISPAPEESAVRPPSGAASE